MKPITNILCLYSILLLIMGLSSCKEYTEDEIMSEASIAFDLPKGILPEGLHLEMTCTNINSKLQFTNNNITTDQVTQRLVQGIYIILIEGVMVYKENGVEKSCRLRGYKENVHFLRQKEDTRIEVIQLKI